MLAALVLALQASVQERAPQALAWSEGQELPAPAVAGAFAGSCDGRLVVAGGASFPRPPWEGGRKEYHDRILVLEAGRSRPGSWAAAGRMTAPLAYGASLPDGPDGWLRVGGHDGRDCSRAVVRLSWGASGIVEQPLASLPEPRAWPAAARAGRWLVVAGGLASLSAQQASGEVHALDLEDPGATWRRLPPCPGPARFLATAGVREGRFYLFGGCALEPGTGGEPRRRYLDDAWSLDPSTGAWRRLADLPWPLAASPSPAPPLGGSHLLLLGGDDGSQVGTAPERHQGFRREILAYDPITDAWSLAGEVPAALVTTPAVPAAGGILIPGGEDRPGHRSRRVLRGRPEGHPSPFHLADHLVLALYLVVIVAVGVRFTRDNRSTDDFFRAGRRIPWWAAGLSIFGTQLSAITFMAIPAKVYATDWTYFPAQLCIAAVAPVVILVFLPRYRSLDVTTAYQYLEARFGRGARLFGSVSFLLFQLGRMGVVLFLPALALSAVTGMSVYLCIGLMGVLATAYTVLGGIEAVIWTDVLQVVVLLGGALVGLALILADLPEGPASLFTSASAAGKFRVFDWDWSAARATFWVVILGNFVSNLTIYATDQTMVQRYMTTPDARQAARSIWVNAGLSVIASVLFYLVGTGLWAWFRSAPERLDPTLGTDAVLPWFIATEMPAGLAGLVVAGIFAAAMSSLDSSMNSIAAVLVTDFRGRRRALGGRQGLRLARLVTVLSGALATGMAAWMAAAGARSMVDVFMTILGLLGASVGGLFLLGVLTRRVPGWAALAGAFTGVGAVLWVRLATDLHFFLYSVVGTGACLAVGYSLSLLRPASPVAAP